MVTLAESQISAVQLNMHSHRELHVLQMVVYIKYQQMLKKNQVKHFCCQNLETLQSTNISTSHSPPQKTSLLLFVSKNAQVEKSILPKKPWVYASRQMEITQLKAVNLIMMANSKVGITSRFQTKLQNNAKPNASETDGVKVTKS